VQLLVAANDKFEMPRYYNKTTGLALITFVNECFPLDPKLEKITDLVDGFALNSILGALYNTPNSSLHQQSANTSATADIDAEYAVQDLEKITSPSVWLANKKRLEAVYKSLQRYLRDNPDSFSPINLQGPLGLNAIAEHNDTVEATKVREDQEDFFTDALANTLCQLLGIFIVAAIKGPSNEKYVQSLINLQDKAAQEEVAKIIQLLQPDVTEYLSDEADLSKSLSNDLDLAAEEAHAKLQADFDNGRKRHADLVTRMEHLQYAHDELQQFNTEANDRIRELEKAQLGDQTDHIQSLKQRIQEDEDLIANQELQLENARVLKENQARELQRLRPLDEKVAELQDELSEIKNQNDILTRKANTADHYQKKLQAQTDLESVNLRLRQQIDTLQENQQEFDRVMDQNVKLEATMSEYRSRFEKYELQFLELNNERKLREEELRQQLSRVQSLTASKVHDENFIADLQEQIRTGSIASLAPPSPAGHSKPHLTLEEELAQSNDPVPNYLLEISRLKAENQLFKGQLGGTTNASLRVELEEGSRVRKRLEESLREFQEKHAILQQQFNAVVSKSGADKLVTIIDDLLSLGPLQILTDDFYRDEAVAATRKLYMEANQEIALLKTKLSETQAELSARDRELVEAKSDLNAVDQEDLDALEELKATHELITSSLQSDLTLLQNKYKNLITDHDQKQSHLVDALLAKDKLSQQLAAVSSNNVDEKLVVKEPVPEQPTEVSSLTNFPMVQSLARPVSFWQKVSTQILNIGLPSALSPQVVERDRSSQDPSELELSNTFASLGVPLRNLDGESKPRPTGEVPTAALFLGVSPHRQDLFPMRSVESRSSSLPPTSSSMLRPPPEIYIARSRSRGTL
jgi:protein HOOK3